MKKILIFAAIMAVAALSLSADIYVKSQEPHGRHGHHGPEHPGQG